MYMYLIVEASFIDGGETPIISKKITVEYIVSLSQHDQSAPKATSPKPQSSKNWFRLVKIA
jgi:hypothetical protein